MYLAPYKSRLNRKQTSVYAHQLIHAAEYLGEVERAISGVADSPVLLTWGARDFAFKQPELEHFERLFPNHRTIILEKAGHFWQEDAAEEVSQAISEWVRSQGSSSPQ